MQDQVTQFPNRLSRRIVLKGLAAFAFAVSEWGCAASAVPSSTPPTPTATLAPGSVIYTYNGHTQVLAVAWSPSGKRVASGSRDTTAQAWDVFTGQHAVIYRGHRDAVTSLSWSPNGQRIASASLDKTVQVWDAASGEQRFTYHGHAAGVTSVSWSPDGKYIASGASDKTTQVWDSSTGRLLYTYRGHTDEVTAVLWSPDGSRIATGSIDTSVQICDASSGNHLYTYRGHTGEISALSWSPDSTYIVSGSFDKSAQVWDASTGVALYTYRGYNVKQASANPAAGVLPDLIYATAWSHNGKRIAIVTQEYCGDDCGVVVTWDALTEQHLIFYPTSPMLALAWSPDDRHFAVVLENGNVVAGGQTVVQITQAL
jgi:WD40 repeat protein